MSDGINYGKLMHQAMQGLLRTLLSDVAEDGLPGNHHFYITFDTTHKGVDMSPHLFDRHPKQMTIVIQGWYDNLAVMSDRFSITLNIDDPRGRGVAEPMVIPFASIQTFVDPSVEFGLRFDAHDSDDEYEADDGIDVEVDDEDTAGSEKTGHDAEVVSLDKFRKH
ncbi:MAG: ClpXP protease specificity-enhancing factor SspB [Paracoccaceae bacterium]